MEHDLQTEILQSSHAGKETADIDVLMKSRNGDRKIMQPIKIRSAPARKMWKRDQFSQFKVITIEKT